MNASSGAPMPGGEPTLVAFRAARLRALAAAPYLARGLLALRPVVVTSGGDASPDGSFGSLPTDTRWRVLLEPETVAAMPVGTMAWWLLHHLSHLVRGHAARSPVPRAGVSDSAGAAGSVSARHWGWAADAEVNDDLVGLGLDAPTGSVLPAALGLVPGRLAEEYLSSIEVLDAGASGGLAERFRVEHCGGACHGDATATTVGGEERGIPPADARFLERSLARDIVAGAPTAVPSGWRRWADGILAPPVEWRRSLRAVVRRAVHETRGRVDYSYARPSRRQSATPRVVLPAMMGPRPEVGVVVDTSASVGASQLGAVVRQVVALAREARGSGGAVTVTCCDTRAHHPQRVRSGDEVALVGGGGTDLRVGIAAALQAHPNPDVIVCLTDGQTPWPTDPPRVPVVIGLLGEASTPTWAHTITISEETS